VFLFAAFALLAFTAAENNEGPPQPEGESQPNANVNDLEADATSYGWVRSYNSSGSNSISPSPLRRIRANIYAIRDIININIVITSIDAYRIVMIPCNRDESPNLFQKTSPDSGLWKDRRVLLWKNKGRLPWTCSMYSFIHNNRHEVS